MGILKRIKPYIYLLVVITSPLHSATDVNLQLRWRHQFQFAGYYMAIEKGYYQAQELSVSLIEGGPNAFHPVDNLINQKADFAISGSGAIISHIQGKPIVALAAIMQSSPLIWITLKKNNLTRPHDLTNKTLSILNPIESAELLTVFKKENISLSNINFKQTNFTVDNLIDEKTHALNAYISNEPFLLQQKNIEYNIINPVDYGVNFYNDVLITHSKLAKSSPELVKVFTKASLQGWQYAFSHIDETVELIHAKYAPHKSIEHLRYEALQLKKLVMPELVTIGHMNPGRWQKIANNYYELGMVKSTDNISDFIFNPNDSRSPWFVHYMVISGLIISLLSIITWRFAYLTTSLRKEIKRRRYAENSLVSVNKKLKILATSDPLTKIYNRRAFFDKGHALLNLAHRKNLPITLFMIDLDNFKSINDEYGHKTGDRVLTSLCDTLHNKLIREHDIFARIGGEEFAILMLDCGIQNAESIALRILNCAHHLQIPTEKQTQLDVTVSIGISEIGMSEISHDIETCLNQADKALYQAKQQGRDQFVIYTHSDIA
ncbi:GGDEF domain-containing protein [Catenovulum adriaticum]|uniref:diguanylate cyclase n=1 Tax=Catenovulum adriaticum TaxID=2984846 RepID=A0ABY7AJ13_9ALTE|nr:GGDEF domain-containing protein [Catenovulum sp. TS8]WAJ69242.1 GGDEF domain-containing protein [Catenovulum sp. TS8]